MRSPAYFVPPPRLMTRAQRDALMRQRLSGVVESILSADEQSLLEASGIPRAASGWPSAVAFRAGNWNFDKGEYTIAQGDTLAGISATYLLDPSRLFEIWSLQEYPAGTPKRVNRYYNKIDPSSKNPGPMPNAGWVLLMPAEATARARQYYDEGRVSAPTTPGAPGSMPDYKAPPTTQEETVKKAGIGLALGVAAVAAYFMFSR